MRNVTYSDGPVITVVAALVIVLCIKFLSLGFAYLRTDDLNVIFVVAEMFFSSNNAHSVIM